MKRFQGSSQRFSWRELSIGPAICRATRLAEPCAHLERLTNPGVLRAMVHLGGIRADVISGGEIRIGDAVRQIPDIGEERP